MYDCRFPNVFFIIEEAVFGRFDAVGKAEKTLYPVVVFCIIHNKIFYDLLIYK